MKFAKIDIHIFLKVSRRFIIQYLKELVRLSGICFSCVFYMALPGCSQFGTPPVGEDLLKLQKSEQYDQKRKQFVNRRPDIIEAMRKDMGFGKAFMKWAFQGDDRVPDQKLPEDIPDLEHFMTSSDRIKIIWLGHSTVLMNLGGTIILFDPVFSESASPVMFTVERFQPPVIELKDLPQIDYVVISHDHYDHLDRDTVTFFKSKKTAFVTPLGVGSHIRGWGINQDRITELDWWQQFQVDGVTFTATPGQHFSGRSLTSRNETLWAGWVVQVADLKVFFSGDTGYDSHFKEIGRKLGPFDLVLLDSGQYNELWRAVHLMPPEVGLAYEDLKAERLIPIHWGMFRLSTHPWYEPGEKLKQLAKLKGMNLLTPRIGQLLELDHSDDTDFWWESLLKGKNESSAD